MCIFVVSIGLDKLKLTKMIVFGRILGDLVEKY